MSAGCSNWPNFFCAHQKMSFTFSCTICSWFRSPCHQNRLKFLQKIRKHAKHDYRGRCIKGCAAWIGRVVPRVAHNMTQMRSNMFQNAQHKPWRHPTYNIPARSLDGAGNHGGYRMHFTALCTRTWWHVTRVTLFECKPSQNCLMQSSNTHGAKDSTALQVKPTQPESGITWQKSKLTCRTWSRPKFVWSLNWGFILLFVFTSAFALSVWSYPSVNTTVVTQNPISGPHPTQDHDMHIYLWFGAWHLGLNLGLSISGTEVWFEITLCA